MKIVISVSWIWQTHTHTHTHIHTHEYWWCWKITKQLATSLKCLKLQMLFSHASQKVNICHKTLCYSFNLSACPWGTHSHTHTHTHTHTLKHTHSERGEWMGMEHSLIIYCLGCAYKFITKNDFCH